MGILRKRDRSAIEDDDAAPAAPLSGTAAVVRAALAADEAAKSAAKAGKGGHPTKAKAKAVSFAPPDEAADEAAAVADAERVKRNRALLRRGAAAGDGELALGEEALAAAPEEGAFTGFNLDEERKTGHFDDAGNYVAEKEERHEEDAWLEGAEVATSAAAEKCRRQAAEEASKPSKLSPAEVGRLKLEISRLLQQGETVLRALKRMGGGGGGAGRGAPPAAAAGGGGAGRGRGRAALAASRASLVDPAQRAAFEKLTELSSTLMAFGEFDVYTLTREAFGREAALAGAAAAAEGPPGGGAGAGAGAGAAAAGPDDDMFDDARPQPPPPRPQPHAQPQLQPQPQPQPQAQPQPPELGSWSVRQLQRLLAARGPPGGGATFVEKGELVAAAAEAARAHALAVPPGWAFSPATGLFTSAASPGLAWDLVTGLFADPAGRWFRWDGAAFAPVEG